MIYGGQSGASEFTVCLLNTYGIYDGICDFSLKDEIEFVYLIFSFIYYNFVFQNL